MITLNKKDFIRNAEVYKLMANAKRLEILNLLSDKELTVKDISSKTGMRMSNLSQHLSILRMSHLLTTRRDGQNIYYRIIDPKIVTPCKVLKELRTSRKI